MDVILAAVCVLPTEVVAVTRIPVVVILSTPSLASQHCNFMKRYQLFPSFLTCQTLTFGFAVREIIVTAIVVAVLVTLWVAGAVVSRVELLIASILTRKLYKQSV